MACLTTEARVAMRELRERDCSKSEVSRVLGVSEGTVRYPEKRWYSGAEDGGCRERSAASGSSAAIAHWRSQQAEEGLNLAQRHEWLVREHDYVGSLRSVQRYWKRRYPAPAIRARRRVETAPGAQVQVDWAYFPRVFLGGELVRLVSLHMLLSWSRKEAVVWARDRKMLSWLHCPTAGFVRLGGVAATARVDNEKTVVSKGAGAWGTINPVYRRYAMQLRFHPDPCAARHPRGKGKVERKIRDQRSAFDPGGKSSRTLRRCNRGRTPARTIARRGYAARPRAVRWRKPGSGSGLC